VAQFTDSANIALSGTYQKAFSWPASGAVERLHGDAARDESAGSR